MSTRSEYEQAKKLYHQVGQSLRKANEKGVSASSAIGKGLRKNYREIKSEYHRLGRKVAGK